MTPVSRTMSPQLFKKMAIDNNVFNVFNENNLAPESHSLKKSTTQFSETEHNPEVGYRSNDEKRAIPEASKTGQNASNVKTADSNNIYEDTTITGSKLQGRGDMENESAIDLENETSTDLGRDNDDSLCCRSNIKETDVKEEKSNGTLPMANSEGLQQNVTKDIRLDGQATMTLKSEDSTTEVLKEKMLTWQGNRSNDSTSNHFESRQNGDVGCRSSDIVLAHHEGNICPPLVCQTGRHTSSNCIGCNQSANILKTDVGPSTNPYDTGSKSKKRRRNKCRADNVPIDRNPEDKISSCQERNKIGPNSQNQAQVIEKSPNALAATSNTSFQQDGNVSVMTKPAHHTFLLGASEIYISSGSQIKGEGPSRACKSSSGSTVLKNESNSFRILHVVLLIIVAPMMAQASPINLNEEGLPPARGGRVNEKSVRKKVSEYTEPAPGSAQRLSSEDNTHTNDSQWQQFLFHKMNGSLSNQFVIIRDMKYRNSERCSFTIPAVPFFHNCSQSRFLIFVKNETAEILTKDLTIGDLIMECGHNRNGDDLPATRGGTLNEKSVKDKIAEYTETADSSAQRPPAENDTRTAETPNEKSQGRSAEDIVKIAAGVGAPLLILVVVLSLLYSFCPNFKSWVDEVVCCRGRRNTNNAPQTGANLESNTNVIPLRPMTSTNGTTNGGLQNGENKSETLSVGLLETDQMETDATTQAEDSL